MTKPVVMFGVALLWLVWFCCWLLISTERYSLERDSARDTSNLAALKTLGWRVLAIWECETAQDQAKLARRLQKFLG